MGGADNSSGRAGLTTDGAEPRRGSRGEQYKGEPLRDGAEPAVRQALTCAYATKDSSVLELEGLPCGPPPIATSATGASWMQTGMRARCTGSSGAEATGTAVSSTGRRPRGLLIAPH